MARPICTFGQVAAGMIVSAVFMNSLQMPFSAHTCLRRTCTRRSLTPFAVCVGDFIWLGRAWPTTQSWFALVAMALCTIFIFVREPSIDASGLFWGVVYYVLLSMVCVITRLATSRPFYFSGFARRDLSLCLLIMTASQDMVWAKKIVSDVKLTTYGRVLYTNLLASVPCGMHLTRVPHQSRRNERDVVLFCLVARIA